MALYIRILCFISIAFIVCVTNDSLKMVQVLFRHGDRTPIYIYKNDPHKHWNDGMGQLTNLGKQQMYNFGLRLKQNYVEFISSYYLPDKVYVRSSYADRTIMSAQLVLAALFPPANGQIWNQDLLWQPIPVHNLPRAMDAVIVAKKPCPVYDVALAAAYKSDRIKQLNEQNKDLYNYLSKYTGEDIRNISVAELLYNTLKIEERSFPLPDWTKNISFDALNLLAAESLAIFTDSELMQCLKGGPLLEELVNNMLKKIKSPYLDLVLYSGHDITIINLMRTLGFTDLFVPDYGAYMVFELHRINDNHEVRVLFGKNFSSDAVLLKLPFCHYPCLLADFVKGVKCPMPIEWEKECTLS